MTSTTKAPRLTPHQRWALQRLALVQRLSGTTFGGESAVPWAHVRDTGSPAAMDTLVAKGYAARRVVRGERGGRHLYYAPTRAGTDMLARIKDQGLKVGGR